MSFEERKREREREKKKKISQRMESLETEKRREERNLRETRVNVMTMFKEKFRRLARYNNTSHCWSRLRTTAETPTVPESPKETFRDSRSE